MYAGVESLDMHMASGQITEIAIAIDGKLFIDKLPKCCPVEAVVLILAMFNFLNLAFPKGLRCTYQFLDIQDFNNTLV